ncbi:hypothetical protein SADUNF_Sadunf16G0192600 [Salix dunnii]|uniref:Uncharacterized protein n=1 Tax=Salix dunnii TaxID=1413687 RepID=A0A835J9D8_9ROSI|nr:hypothetical protein SADUNF_Sadunf16G0192600 [Salix dunnii]
MAPGFCCRGGTNMESGAGLKRFGEGLRLFTMISFFLLEGDDAIDELFWMDWILNVDLITGIAKVAQRMCKQLVFVLHANALPLKEKK